jgi:hypothetical protein
MRSFIKPASSPDEWQNRLRQHGTLFIFFCEKDRESSTLPEPALSVVEWGDIPCHMRDRRISLSSGRFAGFVHVVVFVVQTPTA